MITILTPTYNRGYVLDQLYDSLERQTNKEFIWIVVDDGSQDDTNQIVQQWKEGSSFKIEYFYHENGGKHKAINSVIDFVSTEFVFIVDSDDYLCDDAVDTIHRWLLDLDDDTIAGVSGTRARLMNNGNIELIGEFPQTDTIVASNLERRKKHLLGDKAEVYRTELLKKYHFPEFLNEKFIPENTVWDRIALDGKKLIWHKKPLIVCEYLPDGLTKSDAQSLFEKNIKGYFESYKLLWKGLEFPYNYSSMAEFYRKMKKCEREKEIIQILCINRFQYLLIKLVYYIKRKSR